MIPFPVLYAEMHNGDPSRLELQVFFLLQRSNRILVRKRNHPAQKSVKSGSGKNLHQGKRTFFILNFESPQKTLFANQTDCAESGFSEPCIKRVKRAAQEAGSIEPR